MRWPWRRFEAFFDRHLRREARRAIEAQRDRLIAAINANPTWDEKSNQELRKKRLEDIIESSRAAIEGIYSDDVEEPAEDAFDVDPLFRPLKLAASHGKPVMEQAGMGRQLLGGME
jgi:hypothetical protein